MIPKLKYLLRKEVIKTRQKRKESLTKIYHCILRGINKQDVFFDNQDYFKFKKAKIKDVKN